ncbi:hypothetical protein B0I31_10922 [Saccharothrix carnea]|uniref:Uncharacterized protein n=1 Tax=Saccharothrix carnea TaxID=1280637 RepID=A0A2P8I438_SACCR|nr:hypothetical protein B0I31_10922 [Saccharothrix carnea]
MIMLLFRLFALRCFGPQVRTAWIRWGGAAGVRNLPPRRPASVRRSAHDGSRGGGVIGRGERLANQSQLDQVADAVSGGPPRGVRHLKNRVAVPVRSLVSRCRGRWVRALSRASWNSSNARQGTGVRRHQRPARHWRQWPLASGTCCASRACSPATRLGSSPRATAATVRSSPSRTTSTTASRSDQSRSRRAANTTLLFPATLMTASLPPHAAPWCRPVGGHRRGVATGTAGSLRALARPHRRHGTSASSRRDTSVVGRAAPSR